MKKAVIIFSILALAGLNSKAQPNGGFENWSIIFNIEEPDNWQTLNFLSLFDSLNPLSAFKAIGFDTHSGNYALKLKTVFVPNNPWPAQLEDTINFAYTGKINYTPFSYKYGFPFTGRPQKLEFWSKYAPVGNDTAGTGVVLLKWNGVTHDTIASGKVLIQPSFGYILSQVVLNYFSTASPDSATIVFGSSKDSSVARVGSTLFVDDVIFTGSVGINQQESNTEKVKIFPNPARGNVTILAQIKDADNVQIVDAAGKLAGIYQIQNYIANVNTMLFAEGVYFYGIRDKKNSVLIKGKFNVAK